MRVVETDQTLTFRPVQSQGVVDAMRFGLAWLNSVHDKANPVIGLRINNQNLPVQLEQRIE